MDSVLVLWNLMESKHMKQSIPGFRQNGTENWTFRKRLPILAKICSPFLHLSFHKWPSNTDVVTALSYSLNHCIISSACTLSYQGNAVSTISQGLGMISRERYIENILWWWDSKNNFYILKLTLFSLLVLISIPSFLDPGTFSVLRIQPTWSLKDAPVWIIIFSTPSLLGFVTIWLTFPKHLFFL